MYIVYCSANVYSILLLPPVLDSPLPALLRMVSDHQAALGKNFKEGDHMSPPLCPHIPYSCHFHPPKLQRTVLGVRKIVFEMWLPNYFTSLSLSFLIYEKNNPTSYGIPTGKRSNRFVPPAHKCSSMVAVVGCRWLWTPLESSQQIGCGKMWLNRAFMSLFCWIRQRFLFVGFMV